jgi:hypothetical protein
MSGPTEEAIVANIRQYVREPFNLVLLLIVPPLFIIAMSGAISTFSNVLGGNLGERAGAGLSGLWAAAILTGVASFYLSLASARVDGRLIIAGLRPAGVAAGHAFVTVAIALMTTSVSVVILLSTQEVARLDTLFAAILVASLIYGSIGFLLSVYVHGDLEGSFVIILIFMLDAFVGGPLASGKGLFVDLLPVRYPSEITVAAMVDAPIEQAWWLWSGLYLLAVAAPASVAILRRRVAQ